MVGGVFFPTHLIWDISARPSNSITSPGKHMQKYSKHLKPPPIDNPWKVQHTPSSRTPGNGNPPATPTMKGIPAKNACWYKVARGVFLSGVLKQPPR